MPMSKARQRLVREMDIRRAELRLTWEEVAAAGGVSVANLRRIRNSDAPLTADSEVAIEDGLRWERGSVARILRGQSPVPLPVPESVDPERDKLRAAFDAYIAAGHSEEEALAMLRAQVQRRNAATRSEQARDSG